MDRLVASSDLWPDITVEGPDGLDRICPIGLELTYDFSPATKRMAIAIRGLATGADPSTGWVSIFHSCSEPSIVNVFVSFIGTARQLTADMGMPESAAFQVCDHLATMAASLEPFVQDCFLGRTCAPEPEGSDDTIGAAETQPLPIVQLSAPPEPVPTVAQESANNMLISMNRDVGYIFGKAPGTCRIELELFREPNMFRAVMLAREGQRIRPLDVYKKSLDGVVRFLLSDNVAFETAGFFGGLASNKASMIGTLIMQLLRDAKIRCLPMAADQAETTPVVPVQLASVHPDAPQFVEIFNNGVYIRVPA